VGFELVIGFNELLKPCEDTSQITVTQRLVFSVTVSIALLASGSLSSWVCELSQRSASSFCNCQLTVCLSALSELFSGLSSRTLPGLTGNFSWYSLFSLSMDCTGNTASNNSSIAECMSVAALTWRLLSYCLETGMFTELFHSKGCFCWLHNCGLANMPYYAFIAGERWIQNLQFKLTN
jgi:hypothetical protein